MLHIQNCNRVSLHPPDEGRCRPRKSGQFFLLSTFCSLLLCHHRVLLYLSTCIECCMVTISSFWSTPILDDSGVQEFFFSYMHSMCVCHVCRYTAFLYHGAKINWWALAFIATGFCCRCMTSVGTMFLSPGGVSSTTRFLFHSASLYSSTHSFLSSFFISLVIFYWDSK